MTKKAETTFPRKPDESLVDWTLRWLADADRKLNQEKGEAEWLNFIIRMGLRKLAEAEGKLTATKKGVQP